MLQLSTFVVGVAYHPGVAGKFFGVGPAWLEKSLPTSIYKQKLA